MIVGIDPKVDYAFKHLFDRDQNKDILIHVLDSILQPAPGQHIQDLELLNPFNPKEAPDDKLSILDIKARDQAGRQFNVEMQMVAPSHYVQRILYYACKLHQQQMREGQKYSELRPTVSISFLNQVWFRQVPAYHLYFRLWERQHQVVLSGDLEFHILELPKFTKALADLSVDLDRWLYFLRYAEKIDTDAVPAPLQQQPLVCRALEELQMLTQDELERIRYEDRLKAQRDQEYFTNLSEITRREGREQGRAEGEKIGRVDLIHLCERLLQRPETPTEQLNGLSLAELNRLAQELHELLLNTNKAD